MVGLALCATTQIEHDAASVCVGWLWADSAATIHSIKDRQSHAGHRTQFRTVFLDNSGLELILRRISHESFLPSHSRFGIRLVPA